LRPFCLLPEEKSEDLAFEELDQETVLKLSEQFFFAAVMDKQVCWSGRGFP
jgi:hypothetical protein